MGDPRSTRTTQGTRHILGLGQFCLHDYADNGHCQERSGPTATGSARTLQTKRGHTEGRAGGLYRLYPDTAAHATRWVAVVSIRAQFLLVCGTGLHVALDCGTVSCAATDNEFVGDDGEFGTSARGWIDCNIEV